MYLVLDSQELNFLFRAPIGDNPRVGIYLVDVSLLFF